MLPPLAFVGQQNLVGQQKASTGNTNGRVENIYTSANSAKDSVSIAVPPELTQESQIDCQFPVQLLNPKDEHQTQSRPEQYAPTGEHQSIVAHDHPAHRKP
jgi:hypothetical protein